MQATGGRASAELRTRLEERREEIEAATLARVRAIADPGEVADAAYIDGLRAAVAAAIDYGIQTMGHDGATAPVPIALFAQARLAARHGIPLDTVLRRYIAGYSLLGFYLIEEASRDGLIAGAELQRLTAAQATRFDRLLAAIGDEYALESDHVARAGEESGQAKSVERLMAGEPVDRGQIAYEFDGWHIGLLLLGKGVEDFLRRLARALDCRLLLRSREEETWAWLGARRRIDAADLLATIDADMGGGGRWCRAVAVGEAGEKLAGWRSTHRQAVAALTVARRSSQPLVRYADVALVASALGDDLLAASLRRTYLQPLESERERGGDLCLTLEAYFDADRNVSSAAAALGVNRNTVADRLCAIEQRTDRSLSAFGADFQLALRLAKLDAPGQSA